MSQELLFLNLEEQHCKGNETKGSCTHLCNMLFFYPRCVRQSEAGCTYPPWPRSGDDVVVASERGALKYLVHHVDGIDAHSCGVPGRESSFIDEGFKMDVFNVV